MNITLTDLKAISDSFLAFAPKLVGSLLTLIVGWWLIGRLMRKSQEVLASKGVDPGLLGFFKSSGEVLLKITLIITFASMLGVKTASLIALLGSIGLAIGLALQGSLSNIAGGVLILIFKPFKVGDYIEAKSTQGTVREINVFSTVLESPDKKTVFVPNGLMISDCITNYTETPIRRIDLVVGVEYGADLTEVREVIGKILAETEQVLPEPEPIISVHDLGASSVNIAVRPWVKNSDFLSTKFKLNEQILKKFKERNIGIPFPQMDVHLTKA